MLMSLRLVNGPNDYIIASQTGTLQLVISKLLHEVVPSIVMHQHSC